MSKRPTNKPQNRRRKGKPKNTAKPPKLKKLPEFLKYEKDMTVGEIAEFIGRPATDVIKRLMNLGVMAAQTQTIDYDTAELLMDDYGIGIEHAAHSDETRFEAIPIDDNPKDLVVRPPVVTIMGHVDHGKTTLLDTIRNARVTAGEAGGITQHIGAYTFDYNGQSITFIDTPGHAAFTEMRARGASITDMTILVVAADDGVMPQTREAIDHAKAAKVPIIVAINKMDKPGVNPDRVKQELTEFDLVPEEWGGSTLFVEISALKGDNIEELLENIILTAEIEELKANPKRLALGSVIEAKLDKGRGPVATLLVQNGTLKTGDAFVVGDTYGKVRAMVDDLGKQLSEAGPSQAVEVIGLQDVPQAGDAFKVYADEKEARHIAETRAHRTWKEERGVGKAVSLDDMFSNMGDSKELRLVVRGDTHGSIEALKGSLDTLEVEGTKIEVVRASVGPITETDISLAHASGAIIIGFGVRPSASVRDMADEKGVEIRLYTIIYKILEDIELAMKGMLDPEFKEVVTGQAEVRDTFKISRVGTIGGCYVTDGFIKRDALVRVIREGIVVYEGELASLKRFKDDVKEVRRGFECGIMVDKFNDIKVGDIIEASTMEEVKVK